MRPYQLLFAVSSNEALAKLPPHVEQLARLKLDELAADQDDEPAVGGEPRLRLFEIPPYAFAYVVDRDLRSLILERIYVVLRAEELPATSWSRLLALEAAGPMRH